MVTYASINHKEQKNNVTREHATLWANYEANEARDSVEMQKTLLAITTTYSVSKRVAHYATLLWLYTDSTQGACVRKAQQAYE